MSDHLFEPSYIVFHSCEYIFVRTDGCLYVIEHYSIGDVVSVGIGSKSCPRTGSSSVPSYGVSVQQR